MMQTGFTPLNSLQQGQWFKLICGASFQDLPAIRLLALIYGLVGADCIDVAADPAVVTSAKEGLKMAQKLSPIAQKKGYLGYRNPWVMVSLNDGEDPHFRKAHFNPNHCPSDCSRPCEKICPANAIIFSEKSQGIIEERCYGCGRCLPVCPQNLIVTHSSVFSLPLIEAMMKQREIDALEIHTHGDNVENFKQLWSFVGKNSKNLKLLAISCPEHPELISYLTELSRIIAPLPCPLIWQTDGRPMSGDIGKGTTHATLKLGQKVLKAALGGYVQLAGGTNHHTVPKLRTLRLLKDTQASETPYIAGVAYGSYARSLLSPFLDHFDYFGEKMNFQILDNELFWQAVDIAHSLIFPLKFPLLYSEISTLNSNK